jgi:hypothetical protein
MVCGVVSNQLCQTASDSAVPPVSATCGRGLLGKQAAVEKNLKRKRSRLQRSHGSAKASVREGHGEAHQCTAR